MGRWCRVSLQGSLRKPIPGSTGNAGTVSVSAGSISLVNAGEITGGTNGRGNGGSVFVSAAGGLRIDGALITSEAHSASTGNAGPLTVTAGSASIVNNGLISSAALGSGSGGSVSVAVAGQLSIVGTQGSNLTGITSQTQGNGDAGAVAVTAGALSIASGAISSNTFGSERAAVSLSWLTVS